MPLLLLLPLFDAGGAVELLLPPLLGVLFAPLVTGTEGERLSTPETGSSGDVVAETNDGRGVGGGDEGTALLSGACDVAGGCLAT